VISRRRLLAASALLLVGCSPQPSVQLSQRPPRIEPVAPAGGQKVWAAARAARPGPPQADDALQHDLTEFLKTQQGAYGVAIRDLNGGLGASYEPDDRFQLGSLFKLFLMYEVVRQMQQGTFGLEATIQTIGDYSFPEPPGGIPPSTRATVEEALTAMITVSSNAAALALIELVTPVALEAAPRRAGVWGTVIEVTALGAPGHYQIDARGSAHDVLEFLVKLDHQELTGPSTDRRMIDLLLKQQIEDRLPRLLPPDVPIAHKTADIDDFTHDAGIVYLPGRPFAIAVLAQGTNPTDGKAIVAEVGRIAYGFFASRA
jgi:beta-lactamase class A